VKKIEIIEGIVLQVDNSAAEPGDWTGPEVSYEVYVIKVLKRRLSPLADEADIHTCGEYGAMGVQCCPVCHREYPDECKIVNFPSGRYA
jgi:hypothetical protein